MTMGSRISELRKKNNYSQEYIAEKLEVSRQAVSKWEKDLSHPDTGNLVKLAELLGSSVEYIATGKTQETVATYVVTQQRTRKKFSKKQKLTIAVLSVLAVLLICVASCIVYVKNLPVDWDAGACGGGYATHIFDKYEDELVQKFINGCAYKDEISDVKAIRGTQEATWKDQKIFLQFDLQYQHETEGVITQRVRYTGTRKWIDTFDWGAASIEG